jgi:hypothetical protein
LYVEKEFIGIIIEMNTTQVLDKPKGDGIPV